jgi:hypothetical protein
MRDIILGGSAKIWQAIAKQPGIAERFQVVIGHKQLSSFAFTPLDRVWVLAYSRIPRENTAMLTHLQEAGVSEIVYISSSSTIITSVTNCYEYPRAKKLAEDEAFALPNGKVLTLGLVVSDEAELPPGTNAATTIREIAKFMLAPKWNLGRGTRAHLLRIVDRPFCNKSELALYRLYGLLMRASKSKPCLLRPLDLLLSMLHMRWYGYTYLSNQLWTKALPK